MDGQPVQSSPSSPLPPAVPVAPGDNKLWAIIGYILPILFFVPLLGAEKNNSSVRFHANQQLNLLLFWVVTSGVLPLIPIIGWVLMPVAYIFGLALMVIGIINVQQNSLKALPLIGKIELLK
jgi:uncharacterized membrane protein